DGDQIISTSRDGEARFWHADDGTCVQKVRGGEGVMPPSPAHSASRWKAVARPLETVIEDLNGQAIAWFPVPLSPLATHPRRPLWAGASTVHLYLISLEQANEGGPTVKK